MTSTEKNVPCELATSTIGAVKPSVIVSKNLGLRDSKRNEHGGRECLRRIEVGMLLVVEENVRA